MTNRNETLEAQKGTPPLDEVIITPLLQKRPTRAPDYEAEAHALRELAESMADSPDEILQKLSEVVLRVCRAHSAGISVAEPDNHVFRWRAISGQLSKFIGGTMPRDFSPCGEVLNRGQALLMKRPIRHYPYIDQLNMHLEEVLLMPFSQNGTIVGTVWVVFHNTEGCFDLEDLRVLTSLSKFASLAVLSSQQREELKAAKQEAEEANQLKSTFLANMSHEIRTPLAAILGFADLLKDPGLSNLEREHYLEIMVRNGHTLSVLINDILDLSKVEAGFIQLEFIQANPLQLVTDVVSLLKVKAKEKNIQLEIQNEISTPFQIVTDPIRLKQILTNLVGNALKFTQKGSVTIKSFGVTSETGNETVCFEVHDTGIGIADQEQERIFDMFVQADSSTSRTFGGTGLGLSVSRRLARALGGDLTLTSSVPGLGSTFLVEIPHLPSLQNTESSLQREELNRRIQQKK